MLYSEYLHSIQVGNLYLSLEVQIVKPAILREFIQTDHRYQNDSGLLI